MRVIDGETLYERACDLEAQALAYVGKIVNDESKIEEWKIWSAILIERTAFKHDVFDAPTIEPEPSIPISWIEKQIDWLKSMDNEFSNITAMNISVLVKKWRKENGKDDGDDS